LLHPPHDDAGVASLELVVPGPELGSHPHGGELQKLLVATTGADSPDVVCGEAPESMQREGVDNAQLQSAQLVDADAQDADTQVWGKAWIEVSSNGLASWPPREDPRWESCEVVEVGDVPQGGAWLEAVAASNPSGGKAARKARPRAPWLRRP